MGDRLLQIVKQTGIFVVCAQMILHFKPAECYEKYIRLLIGIMVLAQLIASGSAVFGKTEENFFDGRVGYYKELLEESMEGADMEDLEVLLEKMTMEEVQEQINRIKEEQRAEEQQEALVQQPGMAAGRGEAPKEPDALQSAEEIAIQIDRIEVKTGD